MMVRLFIQKTRSHLEPNTHYTIQIISKEKSQKTITKNAWDLLKEMTGTYETSEH
ncbi:hypothetical protein [Crocosphaera chwakensis]|uniref:Uncharacterized protein n=1 Tax=Crocosphaera chwakensis CCY0110 TaxID=391612 RepID=A3IHD3_9CHRO|nr:hypothetical protein [Crocosphaera chwakensis]EAZ93215.1 hypothetical protein CY0110_15507 [Crocosphaera chwakensis CCY0110]